MALRLLTVLVRYGREQYPHAEAELEAVLATQLPGVERDTIVVDNALRPTVVEDSGGRILIGGDNSVREFSGFDRAIAWVGSSLTRYDYVHFATSAFNTLYTAYLDRFTPPVLAAALTGPPVCLGHIDCYNRRVRIGSFLSQHWIRTCFFFLRPPEVLALGSMVSLADGGQLFSGDPASPFRPDAPLCATYRQNILDWLTGRDIGQGVTWHSGFAITEGSLASFEQKTMCILNEQLLGARLRALGCPLVDVTWLATQLERKDESTGGTRLDHALWSTHWTAQLSNRDRDRVSVGGPQ